MINATKKPFVRYYATTGYEPKSDSGINNATETTTTTSVSAHTPRITTVQYPNDSGTGKPFLKNRLFLCLTIPSTSSDTTSKAIGDHHWRRHSCTPYSLGRHYNRTAAIFTADTNVHT